MADRLAVRQALESDAISMTSKTRTCADFVPRRRPDAFGRCVASRSYLRAHHENMSSVTALQP